MSNVQKSSRRTKTPVSGFKKVRTVGDITEYTLTQNGLTVLYKHISGTGVVTTNITYLVGAKDEAAGESGLAHMLEHMLFKPTTQDLARKIDSSAMQFERETGCVLNANTWQDRTTYYFSYPSDYTDQALRIEAERMHDVVLTDKEFLPERGNVLSEFDMYFGDPHFALSLNMMATAFHAHPYGHETIGFRQDIEAYTPEKLQRFYKNYYRPDNATLMIIGDIDEATALTLTKAHFGSLTNPDTAIPRHHIVEPIQEGTRRVEIVRPATTNIVSIGVKHAGAPTPEWFTTSVLLAVLCDGPESILHEQLVDTGRASELSAAIAPGRDTNLATISITLAPGVAHQAIEAEVLERIRNLTQKDVASLLKKVVERTLTGEILGRHSSLQIARELTEYTAVGDWTMYFKTEEIFSKITPAGVVAAAHARFAPQELTIGYFIGTN